MAMTKKNSFETTNTYLITFIKTFQCEIGMDISLVFFLWYRHLI